MNDFYDLERFVNAQNSEFDQVCQELREGCKTGHWMWFIFPQIRGLGQSYFAHKFGISSREEAEAYLKHPILGPRLMECTRLMIRIKGRSIEEILGNIDSMKFRSSMTLFSVVTPDNQIFKDALQKYFGGMPDHLTIERLK